MISLSNLSHVYPDGKAIGFPDLRIDPMQHWLLTGASGSGKSTLINILSGLLRPSEGEVLFDDISLYSMASGKMDRFRGRHIGIVFQRPNFIKSLTVIENLKIAASLANLPVDIERLKELLDSLNIVNQQFKYPDQLSQGQLQRLSVARALVNQPDLLIADEPTSSLDRENAMQVIKMLMVQAKENGAALVVATHDERIQSFISNVYHLS